MGLRTISKKHFHQNKNGSDFSLNTGDFTTNLTGGFERIKAVYEIAVSATSDATSGNLVSVFDNTIIRSSGSWITDGFWDGDEIRFDDFEGGVSNVFNNRTITYIDDQRIDFDGAAITPTDTNNGRLYNLTPLRAFEFGFGIISNNNEAFNTVSKIDNSPQEFYSPTEVGSGSPVRDTSFQTMSPIGNNKSWQTNDVIRVRFVQDNPFTQLDGAEQVFEIEHTFDVVPFFLDGQLSNLVDLIPRDLFVGNSLKYVFEARNKTTLSNPNTTKLGRFEINLGSVGDYNQNFNGFNNRFAVDSIGYSDDFTGLTTESLQVSGITNGQLVVNSLDSVFTIGDRITLNIAYLPPAAEYDGSTSTIGNTTYNSSQFTVRENFIFESIVLEVDGSNDSSGFITDASATFLNSGQLQIDFQTQYGVSQSFRLDNTKSYVIWVNVEDNAKSSASSDRVSLLCDVTNYTLSSDVPDLLKNNGLKFIAPNKDLDSDPGTTNYAGCIQDGVSCEYIFGLNIPQQAHIQNLNLQVIAYNGTTGDEFTVDSFNIILTDAVIVNGIQEFNINTERNYKLIDGSKFNRVFLSRTGNQFQSASTVDGTLIDFEEYKFQCGYKLPWEQWQSIIADTIFYDTSELNDGLNKNSSNYSVITLPTGGLNPYQLRFRLFSEIIVNDESSEDFGKVTEYAQDSPFLDVRDYDSDITWTKVIETFTTSNNFNLQGGVSDNQLTKIVATWTPDSGDTSILTNPWGKLDLIDSWAGLTRLT